MARTVRSFALAATLLLSLPAVLAQEPDVSQASLCPAGLRPMDGIGMVCPQENGLFEVFGPQLERLGFVHGTDPVPGDVGEPSTANAGTVVDCVTGAAGTYFVQVIYARATNDTDGYAALLPTIRTLVGNANKLVDDAAIATGSKASFKVKCVGAEVEVKNEVLPTAMASASFSTIVTDLRAKGYNDGKVKYWVFYDDTGACSCGGTGNIYYDDTLAVTNSNNGNAVSMFAVDFGYNSVRTWLHELGHNLGAVQNSAPHSTLASHCYDGRDTMCYNDGGTNGSLYSTSFCATEVFDCGNTDYFHANPPDGSYLATKWNLGNPINRFIKFGGNSAPSLTTLTCPTATVETGTSLSCSFVATDDSSGVSYSIAWGDATTTTVPASGFVTPGITQSAAHSYASAGAKTVVVSVIDSLGLAGNSRNATVTIVYDKTAPTLVVTDPEGGFAYLGCGIKRAIPLDRIVWVGSGCVRATASDARSGMNRVEVYVNGFLEATDTTAPYEMTVPATRTGPSTQVRVEAVDNAGNRAIISRTVDMAEV